MQSNISVTYQILLKNIEIEVLWVLYIDFKKAFDSVNHITLFQIMERMNLLSHLEFSRMCSLNRTYTQISTNTFETDKIYLERGVKQGDIISLTLFLIFLAPLQWRLLSLSNKGGINNLAYATICSSKNSPQWK